MTEPPRAPRGRARVALWVAGGVILAGVLFAPVRTSGFCAYAPTSGRSYCDAAAQSVLGIPTSLWLWLAASIALGALGWWLARRTARRGG
ncbi:hypothetical protein [Microbacterium timonense]|uniref:hypothetical protein n=1 Tax=Microbacterium timonense TaxID=2086576 RepID=UPI000D0FCB70|nr:hypothetical protein [Microbacterium timonense]